MKRGENLAKPNTVKSYITKTKKAMESLDVYRKEFDPLIEVYAGMLMKMEKCEKAFEESGEQLTVIEENSKGAVNEKKAPLVTVMESLRKDILAYSDKLCLNPKALNDEKYRSEKNAPTGIESIISKVIDD